MKSTFNHDNWQQALIETNLLIIGFNAWNGYSKAGRGVVVCTTNSPLLDRLGETFNVSGKSSLPRAFSNYSVTELYVLGVMAVKLLDIKNSILTIRVGFYFA